MKHSTLTAWLSALRSGDYEQRQGRLRSSDNHYCCLGVLCDIIDPYRWKQEGDHYSWDHHSGTLPYSIRETQGFDNDIGGRPGHSLVSLNDNGIPFTTIAERLEVNPSLFGISIEED